MKSKIINFLTGASALLLMVCFIVECIIPGEEISKSIERETYGNGDKLVTAVAEIGYKGKAVKKNVELNISPAELSYDEKLERLVECKKDLPNIILSGNTSLEHITQDMDLITFHEATGVSVMWDTGSPELINKDGEVFPGEEKDNGYVLLTALLSIEGEETEFKCNVKHALKLSEENYEKLADGRIAELDDILNEDLIDTEVDLPATLGSNVSVIWRERKDHKGSIVILLIVISLMLIKSLEAGRDKKKIKQRKEEILLEFPGFLDKLTMLLAAGLILREAVERITEDYKDNIRPSGKRIFYEELCASVDMMNNSNSSFSEELTSLAKRLQIREFARLAVILKDSLNSGMDLAEKLENESIMMRYERKNHIQKLGKTADSKLVFPLMIILSVLIVIVMTPAVMQI
ncbi:MAG: type II secretion system F family protein [Clostridiales bacterium]|nr:type II secretion system F family protein [Clostridiales bacterium]